MMKRIFALLLALACALSLAACGEEAPPQSTLEEEDYLPSVVPPLDKSITDYLPAAQVGEIMGVEMTASDIYEHGTWVQYFSADGKRMVSLNMENTTSDLYDAMVAETDGIEATPLVGERAFWRADTDMVLFFHDGYSVSVQVTDPTVASVKGLCEALALKIIANLTSEG